MAERVGCGPGQPDRSCAPFPAMLRKVVERRRGVRTPRAGCPRVPRSQTPCSHTYTPSAPRPGMLASSQQRTGRPPHSGERLLLQSITSAAAEESPCPV